MKYLEALYPIQKLDSRPIILYSCARNLSNNGEAKFYSNILKEIVY